VPLGSAWLGRAAHRCRARLLCFITAFPVRPLRRALLTSDVSSLTSTRLLTTLEVATILRVSKQTVYRLVHAGELEAIRIGGSFRIPAQAVSSWISAASRGA
jgi:excisionase family DNA binding protein